MIGRQWDDAAASPRARFIHALSFVFAAVLAVYKNETQISSCATAGFGNISKILLNYPTYPISKCEAFVEGRQNWKGELTVYHVQMDQWTSLRLPIGEILGM